MAYCYIYKSVEAPFSCQHHEFTSSLASHRKRARSAWRACVAAGAGVVRV